MLAEIASGISSLKAAKDIVQGLNAIKTEAAVNSVKIDLQGLILDAQQGLFAAQEAQSSDARRIAELEQEIVRLKDWTTERERYQLHDIDGRAFAYVKKVGMEDGEPAHWLCAHCFENRHVRSILQFAGQMNDAIYRCANCSAELRTHIGTRPGAR